MVRSRETRSQKLYLVKSPLVTLLGAMAIDQYAHTPRNIISPLVEPRGSEWAE